MSLIAVADTASPIAFTRNDATGIWTVSGTDEVELLVECSGPVAQLHWSTDGKRLLAMVGEQDDSWTLASGIMPPSGNDRPVAASAGMRRHIQVIDVENRTVAEAPVDPGPIVDIAWADDDRMWMLRAVQPALAAAYYESVLSLVDLDNGLVVAPDRNVGMFTALASSPSGARAAMLSGNGTGRIVVADALGVGPAMGPVEANWVAWADEDTLWFGAPQRLDQRFGRLTVDGIEHTVWSGPQQSRDTVTGGCACAVADEGASLVVALDSPQRPPELFVLEEGRSAAEPRQVSRLQQHSVPTADVVLHRWSSTDGYEIDGLLLGAPAGTRRPLVVMAHGGPHGRWSWAYDNEVGQISANVLWNAGFSVLLPNPRGSTGRGEAFKNAVRGDRGGQDFRDIVTGVESLVAAGVADPDSVAIVGLSYGGFLAAWAAAAGGTFAACVPVGSMSNATSMMHTSDMGGLHEELFVGPFDAEEYVARSPALWANRGERPSVLIVHGAVDTRTPLAQSAELYNSLLKAGRTRVEFVAYPGEGHVFARRGNYIDFSQRLVGFLYETLPVPP